MGDSHESNEPGRAVLSACRRFALALVLALGVPQMALPSASAAPECGEEMGSGVIRIGCESSGWSPPSGSGPGKSVGPIQPPVDEERRTVPPECEGDPEESSCVILYFDGDPIGYIVVDPDPDDPAPPDPAVLARRAIATLRLPVPDLRLTPPPNTVEPNTLVNTPTHLWLDPDAVVGPFTVTASDSGLTVTVTARLTHLSLVTDETAGSTPITCALGSLASPPSDPFASPACGHTWRTTSTTRPGGVFTLTATNHWAITWVGGGQSGSVTTATSSDYAVAVTDYPVTLR